MSKMPEFKIGNFTTRLPIIQGGMGVGISGIRLALAVAAEDALPTIATVEMGKDDPRWQKGRTKDIANADALRAAIEEFRKKRPGKTLQVNIMVAQTNYPETVAIASDKEHGADIIACGSALPTTLPELVSEGSRTALVPIVSSAKAARVLCMKWDRDYSRVPEGIIVEGPKAGGHLGFKDEAEINDPNNALEKLVPSVIAKIAPFAEKYGCSIPVIAAGGIYTGEDIYHIMQLGAAGVQLGTRFVTTHECDADIKFKQAYIDAKEEDIGLIDSPAGLPGRAIVGGNEFLIRVADGKEKPKSCGKHCLTKCTWRKSPYCIVDALVAAQEGDLGRGFAFCGINAYRATEIISVHELMTILEREYGEAEEKANRKAQSLG